MNNIEFVRKIKKVATDYKTLYVMGCFGAPLTDKNKVRYSNNHTFNKKTARRKMIAAATSDTFGFDCVCLIKAILWGWNGDKNKTYGGSVYGSNNVPDISANAMIKVCNDVTTDFTKIEIGEAVWCEGHIGVYIGDGLAVESSPAWANCVQITACNCNKAGYKRRNWKKHGKLPYVTYTKTASTPNKKTEEVCDVELNVLKKGAKNSQVKSLQLLLIGNGFSCGKAGADGDFGSGTYDAVLAFQKENELKVDGVVGTNTWKKLLGVK